MPVVGVREEDIEKEFCEGKGSKGRGKEGGLILRRPSREPGCVMPIHQLTNKEKAWKSTSWPTIVSHGMRHPGLNRFVQCLGPNDHYCSIPFCSGVSVSPYLNRLSCGSHYGPVCSMHRIAWIFVLAPNNRFVSVSFGISQPTRACDYVVRSTQLCGYGTSCNENSVVFKLMQLWYVFSGFTSTVCAMLLFASSLTLVLEDI